MLAAFGRLLISDAVKPLIAKGALPPFAGALVALGVTFGWLKWADKIKRPVMKEYFLLIAIVAGMAAAQLVRTFVAPLS